MTKSSRQPDWAGRAAEIRKASKRCHQEGAEAFGCFTDLVNRLFCMTIGHPEAGLHLVNLKGGRDMVRLLRGGPSSSENAVVRLTNGRYLKLLISLRLNLDGPDRYLRTGMSLFQYQLDEAGQDWVFRYEYERDRHSEAKKPASHLQVRGDLLSTGALPEKRPLERVHFPCGRPTVESTIRCLIDDFGVPSDAPDHVWRPTLAESEREFLGHAHRPEPD